MVEHIEIDEIPLKDTSSGDHSPEGRSGAEIERASEVDQIRVLVQARIATALAINNLAIDFNAYETTRENDVHPESNLPFLIAPTALQLPEEVAEKLELYGKAIAAYFQAVDRIFRALPKESKWKKALTNNRPEWMIDQAESDNANPSHLFLRPDFILTDDGVVTTEIETSPFGLALSLFLNDAYTNNDLDTLSDSNTFFDYFIRELTQRMKTSGPVCFVITDHTKRYKGQFEYLAKELSRRGLASRVVSSETIEIRGDECFTGDERIGLIYRGFYLHQSLDDENLEGILRSNTAVVPSLNSHLEEKAAMAMLYDKEMEPHLASSLEQEDLDTLKNIFPETYLLAENPPTDLGIEKWEDLALISKNDRNFILKVSGFSNSASWAKGVVFLNKLSRAQCEEIIKEARKSPDVFVIQKFKKGKKISQDYFDFNEREIKSMTGRVRFTPYFATNDGKLLTAKATMCPNTDFVHAGTNSINSPVRL